jgi:hypothetical protein
MPLIRFPRLRDDGGASAAVTEREARLAALLDRYVLPDPAAAGRRILERLQTLPPQRRRLAWWPTLLARWDFTPSWPRVAALATMAGLGIVIGLSEPDAASELDVSALIFDAGPGVGLGP